MTAYPYYLLTVVRREWITRHMIRIGFGGADLRGFRRGSPDQYLKLFLPPVGDRVPIVPSLQDDDVESWNRRFRALPDEVRPTMRTYTVRRPSERGRGDRDRQGRDHHQRVPAPRQDRTRRVLARRSRGCLTGAVVIKTGLPSIG